MITEGIPVDFPCRPVVVFADLTSSCPADDYRDLVGEVAHV